MIKTKEETEKEVKNVFTYLDILKDSGTTNMFGATPYLVDQFGFDKRTAANYLMLWMTSKENEKV